ncbi:MAG: glycosyltransferase family 4 protein [Oscillatoriales cyanobacterium SM2_2_1]|nr:glycosyltransferase family 4 protein [Oscillatoriales cyanobacterium SM2_2_1]
MIATWRIYCKELGHEKIIHCSELLARAGGGVKTYVDALYGVMGTSFAPEFLASLGAVDPAVTALLHVHEERLLSQYQGQVPIVFTAHNHDAYCPSGTRYFSTSQTPCDRTLSVVGCTWGHYAGGCGSRRPQKVWEGLRRAQEACGALQRHRIPVIANSDFVRTQFLRHGVPPEQVVTLRYGIREPEVFCPPLTEAVHRAQRILFLGRIVPDKGLDWLLETLKLLPAPIHLDIAGDGWYREQVQGHCESLGLGDRVTWHGWCNGVQLDALFAQCFAVVFPSLWHEPAGIVTLEAYARHRPIIASAVGGIPEHVRAGETGLLVPVNDRAGLAAAIAHLVADRQQAIALGLAGRRWYEEAFTIAHHARLLQSIYDRTISQWVPA